MTDLVWDAIGPSTKRTHVVSKKPRSLQLFFFFLLFGNREGAALQQRWFGAQQIISVIRIQTYSTKDNAHIHSFIFPPLNMKSNETHAQTWLYLCKLLLSWSFWSDQ